MFIPSLPHIHFSYFDYICNLGSNGSSKLKGSLLFLIPFWRAALALILECYVHWRLHHVKRIFFEKVKIQDSTNESNLSFGTLPYSH
jgi:hypothetical protein